MKELLLKGWNWLVVSSADPEKLALTVKAGVPTAVLVLGLFGLHLNAVDANNLVDVISVGIANGALLASSLMTAYGLARKIYLTLK